MHMKRSERGCYQSLDAGQPARPVLVKAPHALTRADDAQNRFRNRRGWIREAGHRVWNSVDVAHAAFVAGWGTGSLASKGVRLRHMAHRMVASFLAMALLAFLCALGFHSNS